MPLKYRISYKYPASGVIEISLQFTLNDDIKEGFLQLPAWRPGRYELQNFSRNLLSISAKSINNEPLTVSKILRERWKVEFGDAREIEITYRYYCKQMDAGGCWLDDDQLYLNFIACIIYPLGMENEAAEIELDIPDDYKIACGLRKEGKKLIANNILHLLDSPMIASHSLSHDKYESNGIDFHIWIHGNVNPPWDKLKENFKKFTDQQILRFGEFPEKDYHFLFEIVPNKQHHGVEHRNSTIIVLGPDDFFNERPFELEFLSISSHELYHAWNICKIRPVEMMPYDLTQENYFKSGFIAEGVTTFYGELFLWRSRLYSEEEFVNEFNGWLKKHFENFGDSNLSVADSSFDLWVDGYSAGIPNRKVSIYNKGAMISFLLHTRLSEKGKSLDLVMKRMWEEFGKNSKGYSIADFRRITEEEAGYSLKDFFDKYVFGVESIYEELKWTLNYWGAELLEMNSSHANESIFGFRVSGKDHRYHVESIQPGSPAEKVLSKDDEILAIDDQLITDEINNYFLNKSQVKLTISRRARVLEMILHTDGKSYFKQYKLHLNEGNHWNKL